MHPKHRVHMYTYTYAHIHIMHTYVYTHTYAMHTYAMHTYAMHTYTKESKFIENSFKTLPATRESLDHWKSHIHPVTRLVQKRENHLKLGKIHTLHTRTPPIKDLMMEPAAPFVDSRGA